MTQRLLVIGALILAGGAACSYPQPRRQTFQYSNLVLIRAEAWEVDQACARLDTRNDEGARIRRRIRCCWDPNRRQMWVAWDDVACVPHEMCHVDNQSKDVCRQLHWE